MTPRKPIIYGPDGAPLVRVNDRLAPKPRVGAGLEGWVSWGLIDRRGNKVAGGEQHNLILDTFLNAVGTTTALLGVASLDGFLSHFAVGTGSTPPDVTDTALDNELARTTTLITFSTTRVANGEYELTLEREFDFGVGNGNLTEFGFAGGASSGMLVRELFRDGMGSPVTITKTSDYKLRIRYVLTIALSPVSLATPASFSITGIGTIGGAHTFLGATANHDLWVFARLAQGRVQNFPAGGAVVKPRIQTTVITSYGTEVRAFTADSRSGTDAVNGFTAGVHERTITSSLWGTSNGNAAGIRSITVSPADQIGTNSVAGWGFAIDAGDAFTKDSLHTLTIDDLLTVSWGRA